MDAQGFLAALAPAVSDADARERFLADPRAVLAAAGLDLPQWFAVSAREGDAAELTITLPALSDPDTDLSDADLDAVGGGTLFGGWQPTNTYGSGQPGCTG
ncbi:MAG: NHLP leader peptide family natural product precursor [Actinomycetia bacterium]|nr:NHLP leader peptide family natural product precursor [Actinomycetes bacterium]